MKHLHVFIRGQHAGTLKRDSAGNLSFSYDATYSGPDLSAAFPFTTGGCLSDHKVRTWFAGVLPDNADVRANMSSLGGGGRSTYSLLSKYGMDLPGAVQVANDEDAADIVNGSGENAYGEISRGEIAERLESIMSAESRAWMAARERWSLGGGQPKLALARIGESYYECYGRAPSNVIVKPGIRGGRFRHLSLDEAICMTLAKAVGIPCADVRMESFEDVDAIVVNRFDRVSIGTGAIERVHQEDLCQALSVYPDRKYPNEGGPDSAGIMELLKSSSEPQDRMRFFDALVFNHLIAAPDGHGKNYSLLHLSRGSFRLAPLYDIASVAPYMQPLNHRGSGNAKREVYRCAMSVGGENRIGRLRKSCVERFAKLHDMNATLLSERVELLSSLVIDNLEPAVNTFSHCPGDDEIGSLLVSRIRVLCETTARNVHVDGKQAKFVNVAEIG